jgi:hypothetical protein
MAALGALTIACGAVGGCTDRPNGAGGATSAGSTTAPTSPEASPASSTGRLYRATDLDLCTRTSLAPLADLSLTVQRTDPTPPRSAPGAACLFEMRTEDGHIASLRVEAATPPSIQEAQRLYRATEQVTVMQPDGSISGIGDEAEGFSKQSEPGFKYSEYLVQARTGNLVAEVWLAVGGKDFVPKQTLAARSRTILAATLAQVPRS